MQIDLSGDKIRFLNTLPENIDRIMTFEKENNRFVTEESREKHLQYLKDKNCLHLSLFRLDNGQLVGHILMIGLENPNNVLEFRRIAIHEKGQGFGRDTLRLLKKLAFEIIGCHRLWLDVYEDNARAIKLYESEGFIREGLMRERVKAGSVYRSQWIYSMLEDEYRGGLI